MKNIKIFFLMAVLSVSAFLAFYGKVGAVTAPALKEGTYLAGQTLSVWPSWSTLGNLLGQALPIDPINQLGLAGTCASHTNIFCTQDSQCQNPVTTTSEKCVLHDPETGWSVANRRFSFACSRDSYAYRYIVSTTPGAYTVRARFEDTGIPVANLNNFVSSFISTTIFKIDDSSGICNQDQEISTLQSGICGDGKINPNEQCDPPGRIRYGTCDVAANTVKVDVCNRSCQWAPSTTPYISCSALSKCGNGVKEPGETCDEGSLNGKYNHCSITCGAALNNCGDGIVQTAYEVCDPCASGASCVRGAEKYAPDKNDSCGWDCQNFGPYCGDKIVNGPEECDGNQSCSVDGRTGVRICANNCKMSPSATSSASWICAVSSTAATVSAPGTCGDAAVGANEACDRGAANNGKPCLPTYGAPCSYCSADCQNTIDVQPLQYCGNGVIENPEKCEVAGGIIYAAVANSNSTVAVKDIAHNGYQELACSAEATAPHTIKKGTKNCAACAAGVVRNCAQCGQDASGVSVAGGMINVLDNSLIDSFLGSSSDPIFAKNTNDSSLSLAVGGSCVLALDTALHGTATRCGSSDALLLVAKAVKNRASSEFEAYTLLNPFLAGSPTALINSDPSCSVDDNPYYKYRMYVNYDWTRPLNFPIVAEPQTWQYDLVLSPVVSSTRRAQDLRVVASWVGSGDFYSGVLNPFIVNPEIEGPSYALAVPPAGCTGIGCTYYYEYATGTNYYNLTTVSNQFSFGGNASTQVYKKYGIWYHGFDSTPGQTSAEAFTIDTSATGGMSGNTYSFYVRSPGYPIRQFKNTARLKVDVYLPESDANPYHFGTPVKTYYFNTAAPSDNQSARYWQVFNINKPSSILSISDIIDVNAIVTDPARFQYITLVPAASAPVVAPVFTIVPPAPTCSDGILNGTETGRDCGGSCPACPIVAPVFTVVPPALTASCSVSPTTAITGQNVTWIATPSGGTGSYTYSWSGTDSLVGTTQSVAKSYSSAGVKNAAVNVISGTQTINQSCNNTVTVSVPATAPTPPRNLRATTDTTGDHLAWDAPLSDGGSPLTLYLIYRNGLQQWTTTPPVTTFNTFTANLCYTVRARNAVGDSAFSNQVCTTAAAPAAPTLSMPGVGRGFINLSWTVPASDGGSAINGYILYRGTSPGGETPFLIFPASQNNYTDTSLVSGLTYYYRVAARNAIGESVLSNELSGTP